MVYGFVQLFSSGPVLGASFRKLPRRRKHEQRRLQSRNLDLVQALKQALCTTWKYRVNPPQTNKIRTQATSTYIVVTHTYIYIYMLQCNNISCILYIYIYMHRYIFIYIPISQSDRPHQPQPAGGRRWGCFAVGTDSCERRGFGRQSIRERRKRPLRV